MILRARRKRFLFQFMQIKRQPTVTPPFERVLAIVAAMVCLIITILFWLSVSAYQPMWPLPALYFIEMITLSIISAFSFVRGDPSAQLITWGAAGIICTFSLLGAFSVGFFYVPVALLFIVIAITSDVRNKRSIPAHLGIFLVGGLAQAALMLVVIQWLH